MIDIVAALIDDLSVGGDLYSRHFRDSEAYPKWEPMLDDRVSQRENQWKPTLGWSRFATSKIHTHEARCISMTVRATATGSGRPFPADPMNSSKPRSTSRGPTTYLHHPRK